MGKQRLCNNVELGSEEVVYVCVCNGDEMEVGTNSYTKKKKRKF